MAIPGTQPVFATIAPSAVGDTYPTHDEVWSKGGYRSVADNTERDGLSSEYLREGMLVFVTGTGLTWQLAADLTTWNEYKPVGAPGADVMLKSTYDVGDTGTVDDSKALDGQLPAFYLSRTNHTGTQAIATVTGLQTALDAKMAIADYDSLGTAVAVDNSRELEGEAGAYYLDRANHTGAQDISTINNLQTALDDKLDDSLVGVANGLVPTNAGNTIDPAFLGITLSVPLEGWDANTNTPIMSDASGNPNEYTFVTVAGTQDLGSGNLVCAVGNFLYHDGVKWNLVPTTGFGVSSVTTATGLQTGAVTVNSTAQINASADRNYVTDDEQDAITNAATPPTAANPFVTEADLGIVDIVTDNGTLNGASVTLDDTSYIAPSTDRNYVDDDQLAAIAGAESPSASNVLVTESRLLDAISVTGGLFTPFLFADGKDIGIGTMRTLASLGYTGGTAAAAFPKTAADPRFTINVNTTTIDTIVLQEWFLASEQACESFLFCPGGRGFYTNQTIYLPRNQSNWSGSGSAGNRSLDRYIIDFSGSGVINGTALNYVVLDRFPANQTDALSNYLNTRFTLRNLFVSGNTSDLTNTSNIALRLGPTTKSRYESIYAANAAVPMAMYFNICCELDNCEFINWGTYGLLLSTGTDGLAYGGGWSGGATSNCQTNQTTIINSRWVTIGSTAAAAIHQFGGYNTRILDPVIEGLASPTTTTLIHYKAAGDQVEQLMDIDGLSVEALTCTRAGIRIESEKGFTKIARCAAYLSGPGNMPVWIEGDSRTGTSGQPTIILENQYGGLQFRSVNPSGTSSFQYRWIIKNAFPADYSNIFAPANWASDFSGQVPGAQFVRYEPPLSP